MASSEKTLSAIELSVRRSLLRRVVLASLYFSIVSSVVMGFAAYYAAGQMLERRTMEQLTGVMTLRRDVASRILRDQEKEDSLVMLIDSGAFGDVLFETASIGRGAEILFAERHEDQTLTFFQRTDSASFIGSMTVTEASQRFPAARDVLQALQGGEGTRIDSQAIIISRVIAGQNMAFAIRMPLSSARAGIDALTVFLAGITALLLGTASVFSVIFARKMTREMHMLIEKVLHLAPGHWGFPRTIRTGDEAELLDAVVADLTKRLRDTFWGLEGEIDARTEDLREASAKDRTILDTIEHGILLFDSEGKVTGLNPAAVHLIGNRKNIILGSSADDALPLHARRKELTDKQHPVLRCIATHQRFVSRPDARLSIMRKDGTILPILLVVSPIVERGRCHGGIAVFQDITEERQIDYMKSEFISLASHQLRTPLSALLWYIELLDSSKGTRMNAEQRSYIREMETAAKRMSNLVDALLQVSRLEGGGIRPAQSIVDLSSFLGEFSDEARTTAKDGGVSVTLHVPVRPVHVRTDPTLLAIVLQNLLSNAVKYTHSGGHVAITLRKKIHDVEISVSDDGIGIPQKEQQHLFQKLFRAKNVHKVDATGSGLGLYITKMVMGTLKGSVRLKSVEGKGTEVTIRLPLKKGK